MAYTFNGATKRITLSSGTTSVDLIDLYSRWKGLDGERERRVCLGVLDSRWEISSIPLYLFAENGWRIIPQTADHTARHQRATGYRRGAETLRRSCWSVQDSHLPSRVSLSGTALSGFRPLHPTSPALSAGEGAVVTAGEHLALCPGSVLRLRQHCSPSWLAGAADNFAAR